jgi:hypothetical protein
MEVSLTLGPLHLRVKEAVLLLLLLYLNICAVGIVWAYLLPLLSEYFSCSGKNEERK